MAGRGTPRQRGPGGGDDWSPYQPPTGFGGAFPAPFTSQTQPGPQGRFPMQQSRQSGGYSGGDAMGGYPVQNAPQAHYPPMGMHRPPAMGQQGVGPQGMSSERGLGHHPMHQPGGAQGNPLPGFPYTAGPPTGQFRQQSSGQPMDPRQTPSSNMSFVNPGASYPADRQFGGHGRGQPVPSMQGMGADGTYPSLAPMGGPLGSMRPPYESQRPPGDAFDPRTAVSSMQNFPPQQHPLHSQGYSRSTEMSYGTAAQYGNPPYRSQFESQAAAPRERALGSSYSEFNQNPNSMYSIPTAADAMPIGGPPPQVVAESRHSFFSWLNDL